MKRRGIAYDTALALLTRILSALSTSAVTVVLVRALGPNGYGLFNLALGIGSITLMVGDCGIAHSMARFLASADDDPTALGQILRVGSRLRIAIASCAAGALFVASDPIAAAYGNPELVWPLRVMAIAVFAQSLMALYIAAFISLGRLDLNLRLVLSEAAAEAVATITIVLLGAGAVGAALGRMIGYLVGALLSATVAIRLYMMRTVQTPPSFRAVRRQIARYAAPLSVVNVLFALYANLDVLLIGGLRGAAAVGIFSAPFRLTVPMGYLGQSVASTLAPRQARPAGHVSVAAFRRSYQWLAIIHAGLAGSVFVWAPSITRIVLGPKFESSATVLRLLSIFICLQGLSPLLSTTLNYLGKAERRIPLIASALMVKCLFGLSMIPRWGSAGAAIATSAAACVYVLGHLRLCAQELRLSLTDAMLTLVRAVIAAAIAAVVVLRLMTDTTSLLLAMGGAVTGLLVFGVCLVLLGAVAKTDLLNAITEIVNSVLRLRALLSRRQR